MTELFRERMTADVDDEFAVFIIGMRINRFWKIHKWLPVALSMPKMVRELYQNPEMGLLSHESWVGRTTIMIQYWKSFNHLERYAKADNLEHLPAWKEFNRKIGRDGDVGIWHETYISKKGNYESVYINMPRFGLAKVGRHLPARGGLKTASGRLKRETHNNAL